MQTTVGIPCAFKKPEGEFGIESSAIPQSYMRALEMAGGVPLLIPITDRKSTLRALYERIDGLLLAGGVDINPSRYGEPSHPAIGKIDVQRDWVELTLVPWAMSDGLPVMGICRGIQTINVAAGGSLWQDMAAQLPDAHPTYPGYPYNRLAHSVQLAQGSRLAEILDTRELKVNSLHHQAIKEVGKGLHVTAWSPDGVIEGIESNGETWVVGVQWHPERLLDDDPRMKQLFETFVAACRERKNGQKT